MVVDEGMPGGGVKGALVVHGGLMLESERVSLLVVCEERIWLGVVGFLYLRLVCIEWD